jgi:high-affinity iron transporter
MRSGVALDVYSASAPGIAAGALPATLTLAQVADLNGGRLPLGAATGTASDTEVPISYRDTVAITWWIEPRTHRVVDIRWAETLTRTAALSIGNTVVGSSDPVTSSVTAEQATAALDDAQRAVSRRDDRATLQGVALLALLFALGAGAWLLLVSRCPQRTAQGTDSPARPLVKR